MTPGEAVLYIQQALEAAGLDEARLQAEALVRHVLGADRAHLYAAWRDEVLTPQHWQHLQALLQRRLRREPLAYITGHWEFYGLDFLVDRRVLVPRPETELLVEKALEIATTRYPQGRCTIADIGTGSGNIAIAVAHHLPLATVYATDISAQALAVAAENTRRHKVDGRVHLLQGDLLAPLPRPVDIIVSNPPYVSRDDLTGVGVDPEVLHEPRVALDGGAEGLDVIQRLLEQAPGKLAPGGVCLMEMSPIQAKEVRALGRRWFPCSRVESIRDLAGFDRVVVIEESAVPQSAMA